MFDFIKNRTIYLNKYRTHSEAVIISCFYNPENSAYRLKAFETFYKSIKHLNHRIVECVIGEGKAQLGHIKGVETVYTENLLFHKEALLNKAISQLPAKFKYVFWIDADVIFTNKNWLVDGVGALKHYTIIQPFEYCVHLEKDETSPSAVVKSVLETRPSLPNKHHNRVWKSFCSNYQTARYHKDENYNNHGHVGFAWGAQRSLLDRVPLYDKALIGGADHIIAHAAANQIIHPCIAKSFTENLDEIRDWSELFALNVLEQIGYVKGNLYHIWHGDILKRQYLKRIQDFSPQINTIVEKDQNGLYVTNKPDDAKLKEYYRQREDTSVTPVKKDVKVTPSKDNTFKKESDRQRNIQTQYPVQKNDGFMDSLMIGYMTDSSLMGTVLGGNPMGAMIGDMLNSSDEHKHESRDNTTNDTPNETTNDTPQPDQVDPQYNDVDSLIQDHQDTLQTDSTTDTTTEHEPFS